MPRRSFLALGLLALALAVAPPARGRASDATPDGKHTTVPHGGAPEAHDAPAENPNILEFKPSLAIATLIVFAVLLAVLWRFAWGPLAKALHDREHHQEELLRKAEEARAESERLLAEHRAQMAAAEDRVRAILDEGRRDAEASAAEIGRKAQADADASRDRARREIETARDQALVEIWNKSADLAVSVAGRVLPRELNADDHRRLVEVAMSELPAAPNGHGGQHA